MHVKALKITPSIILKDIPNQLLRLKLLAGTKRLTRLWRQQLMHDSAQLSPLRRIPHEQESLPTGEQACPDGHGHSPGRNGRLFVEDLLDGKGIVDEDPVVPAYFDLEEIAIFFGPIL